MGDILELSHGTCTIRREAGWWIIGSNVDWLADPAVPAAELFRRMVATPGRGEHSMRGEILVTAFARTVWTAHGETRERIEGEEPPAIVWVQTQDLVRELRFHDVTRTGRRHQR